MSLTRDDIRAAVQNGTITEAQAAGIVALSDARRGARENLHGLDEPFELFKGFNEIFIVVGLSILYAGWAGLTAVSVFAFGTNDAGVSAILFGLAGIAALAGLATYFTRRRRMVAPSIALTVMVGLSATQIGIGLGNEIGETIFVTGLCCTIALTGFWAVFRIPFAMLLIALSVFTACFGLLASGGGVIQSPLELFLLSDDGPLAILTIGLGLLGFAIALWFDMSDPHRVTRRAQNGFWLHIISAPAIVNTVALTLFQAETIASYLTLLCFLAVIAVMAIAIDRRSFLVSGVGYVVALAVTVAEDQAFWAILLLGVGLVLLGAQWEKLRRGLMNTLPSFPGKTRLPPWDTLPPAAPAVP
ncbi:hypothetical protein [Actibacterium sp. 188UL27-1]|uniref:hypothetical protein n=1 Tax=Actibacterium sp. 188UL27-1 TaxID=2786961 RepID=UPI001956BE9A|nr:hypothetical protein [Actibacterium sp. 188UL27-1]MBM7067235.1 hypothetical protein [Actibacterium sp. 188UL27-1]